MINQSFTEKVTEPEKILKITMINVNEWVK